MESTAGRGKVTATRDIIYDRGKAVPVRGLQVGDKRLVVQGTLLKIARLKDEWYHDMGDPDMVIDGLRGSRVKPDLFTFWQRLPDTRPQYKYYHEKEMLSAVPLTTFKHWWNAQINSDTRKKAKRAEKRGIEIKVVPFDDALIRGVIEVFNDTPMRRGKPFWHYGKDYAAVKEILARDIAASKFIGAYSGGELVGFVKLVYASQRFANPGLIVSKLKARKQYVNNALLAKSVELCCADNVPYLTYTQWRRGSHAEFLARHGFERTPVPRYWIPLTISGKLALRCGFHRDIRMYIPDPLMDRFLSTRAQVYRWWYSVSCLEPRLNP